MENNKDRNEVLDADEIYDETLEVANEQYSNSSEL